MTLHKHNILNINLQLLFFELLVSEKLYSINMAQYIAYFVLVLISIVILITSFGILRTNSTLQKLHFSTIIDIICLPLVFCIIILMLGGQHTRIVYSMTILIILSPISGYFTGKLYYTSYKHQIQSEQEISLNKD
jgi:multisubunit Na+/H+ antiporter MnhG subunit